MFDFRNKERSLRRIQQLASAGLPLEPFVAATFETLGTAVPSLPLKVFWFDGSRPDAYILNEPTLYRDLSLFETFFVKADPTAVGLRARFDLVALRNVWNKRAVWPTEGWALPHFTRRDAYNLVIRPQGWRSMAIVMLREAGEVLGVYPIWRASDEAEFSTDELKFLEAAAPHLACGLKTARMIQERQRRLDEFLPSKIWGTGVILMNRLGQIVAMDEPAERIFGGLAAMDGLAGDQFAARSAEALDYVHRITLSSLRDPGLLGRVPVFSLFSHSGGALLRFRGAVATGSDGREYVTVLVERGESVEYRRRRSMVQWGLSSREAQVLSLIGQGKTNREIAIILEISARTVGKHVERIFKQLGAENRTTAAAMVLEITNSSGD